LEFLLRRIRRVSEFGIMIMRFSDRTFHKTMFGQKQIITLQHKQHLHHFLPCDIFIFCILNHFIRRSVQCDDSTERVFGKWTSALFPVVAD